MTKNTNKKKTMKKTEDSSEWGLGGGSLFKQTLPLAATIIIGLFILKSTWDCANYLNSMNNTLMKHSEQLTNQAEQISDTKSTVDKISAQQNAMSSATNTYVDSRISSMGPTRWTYPMDTTWKDQFAKLNPTLKFPDEKQIHDIFQPVTQ